MRLLVKPKNQDETYANEDLFGVFDDKLNGKGKSKSSNRQNKSRRLFVCGTNAFNPRCRYYKQSDGGDERNRLNDDDGNTESMVMEKEISGKGFCPYDPKHNSTRSLIFIFF